MALLRTVEILVTETELTRFQLHELYNTGASCKGYSTFRIKNIIVYQQELKQEFLAGMVAYPSTTTPPTNQTCIYYHHIISSRIFIAVINKK